MFIIWYIDETIHYFKELIVCISCLKNIKFTKYCFDVISKIKCSHQFNVVHASVTSRTKQKVDCQEIEFPGFRYILTVNKNCADFFRIAKTCRKCGLKTYLYTNNKYPVTNAST